MASNLWNWLSPSPKGREHKENHQLLARVRASLSHSPFYPEEKATAFVYELIEDICERRGIIPTVPLGQALWDALWALLYHEGFHFSLGDHIDIDSFTIEEGVEFRALLNRYMRFVSSHERLLPIWREKIAIIFSGMLEYFPLSAFMDLTPNGEVSEDAVILPEAKAYDVCDNLPEVIERLIVTVYDEDVKTADLFRFLRERFEGNLLFASGLSEENRHLANEHKLKLPTHRSGKSPEYLVEAYLRGTPFSEFLTSTLPFAIPFPARFEHTHIVGGTGHGKTQLMQFLINHDLVRAQEDGRSVVVMDSQGDLIRTIAGLGVFSPEAERSLADRFVLIDPNDIEHPVCLNMFDFNRDRLSGFAPVDREKILNATVELYEYFFGALLGAELTQRQGLIFRYLARLMLEIPDATIHTLRELMENGEAFRPYMAKLPGAARSFFATRFFDRQFNETKKQILTRLWGVLSNASLERMFSHSKNKIDIFELLNQGKIILINTAKDLLGQEGTAIFGRFFISLIAQAVVQRSALPPHERNPSFVYIDEAHDYFDDNVSHILNQARKYRVGLVFAHQNLDQLGAGLRASVLASTSIKFAGGLSAKDAHTLGTELRTDSEFLLTQRKGKEHTEFACFVKNYTSSALSVRVPLGYVEALPKISYEEHLALIDYNRRLYTAPPMLPAFSFEEPAAETAGNISAQPSQVVTTDRVKSASNNSALTPISERRLAEEGQDQANPLDAAGALPAPPREAAQPKALSLSTESPPKLEPSGSGQNGPAPGLPAQQDNLRHSSTRKARPKTDTDMGRGGQKHRYLQNLIKQLAEQRGFRATIEETVLDGAGRVDVSLSHGGLLVAFEVSVTTNRDHELGNIEKCLAAGYSHVVLVGENERHVRTLSRFIKKSLDGEQSEKLQYVWPEVLPECIDALPMDALEERQTVRGYKVRVTRQSLSEADVAERRAAVARVIARSLSKSS